MQAEEDIKLFRPGLVAGARKVRPKMSRVAGNDLLLTGDVNRFQANPADEEKEEADRPGLTS